MLAWQRVRHTETTVEDGVLRELRGEAVHPGGPGDVPNHSVPQVRASADGALPPAAIRAPGADRERGQWHRLSRLRHGASARGGVEDDPRETGECHRFTREFLPRGP